MCRNSWRCRRISVGDAGFVVEEVERSGFVVDWICGSRDV